MQDKLKLPNNLFFSEVEQWLAAERSVELPAKGRSMWPFVVEGRDKIVLRRPATVRMGDIVLARMEQSRYVLHRVYRLEKDAITLMGDGNCYAQEHCRLSDICGVATEIVRKGQRVDCTYKLTNGNAYKRMPAMALENIARNPPIHRMERRNGDRTCGNLSFFCLCLQMPDRYRHRT